VAGVGLGSVSLAELLPPRLAGLAGYMYFGIGLIEAWHGSKARRLRRRHTAS
jgi:hypothetical protein